MTVKHVWMGLVLAASVVACEKSTSPTYHALPPLANLRYFDAVPDTGYMDIRIVDIINYAPSTVRAIYRNGGNPYGISTSSQTPYLPVETGQHQIRVFLDSTDAATASTILFDTTCTFNAGVNYTFVVFGSARAAALHAMVLADTGLTLPADTASTVWVRSVHLAADTTGLGASDVFVTAAAAPAGAPTFASQGFSGVSAYSRVTIGALKAYLTRTGTLAPVTATGTLPAGTVGTASTNPIAGALVKNTAISILTLPRVIPDTITSLTNVVTGAVDTIFATTSQPHHLATGNSIHIYGATPAAYNGTWAVVVTGATTLKWAYTLAPPVSPATGTIVYNNSWKDYPNPGIVFLIDQQPPLTAP